MPTKKQIDALLAYLDRFTAEGFSVGTWHSPPGVFPWLEFNEAVSEFQRALYDNGWITSSFNWPDWQETAKEYVEKPETIQSADAKTIQKLFTTHVRKERFCEGHLAAMFENGHVVALLRRLKAIRGNLNGSSVQSEEGDRPMPPPEKVVKEFPREGDMQLFRLEKLYEFQCVRCQAKKKSKLVAVQGGDWSKLLCNGCYGLLQSKKG